MDNKLRELSKPVRIHNDWNRASMSHCGRCDEWEMTIADSDGTQTCASCYDAEVLSEWQNYAEAAEKRIADLERARFIAWPGAMFAPVLAKIKVDVKRRDGSVSVGQSAGNVVWYHSDSPSDVVAFALAVEGDE